MMKDSDRHSLIQYRIRQAKETIELADFLINSNKLAVAVNRIYYGIYYALTALALKHNYETSKHAQLIGWFNKEFVSNDLIDKKYGRILRNAYQNRAKGDYDAFVDFSRNEVEEMLNEMKQFITAVESIL